MFSCRRSLTDDADSRRSTIDLDATPVGESSNGYIGKFRVVLIDKRALRERIAEKIKQEADAATRVSAVSETASP